jgi:hypothetical protein
VQNNSILFTVRLQWLSVRSIGESDFLQLPPFSLLDISKALNPLRHSQSVVIVGAPGTIINGCSTEFAPLLKNVLYLSLSQEHCPTQWGKNCYCSILKNDKILQLVIIDRNPFQIILPKCFHSSHNHMSP